MARSRKRRLPDAPVELLVESLAPDGRGVARHEGKTVFVDEALPGERVRARLTRRLKRHDEARAVEVLAASAERVTPRCPHFGVCGGCSLQHLEPAAQVRHKQAALLEQLRHVGAVVPERLLEPVTGPVWGYRRKARLGVKHVPGKGGVLVGFRERRSSLVAPLRRCEILIPAVGERLEALAALIGDLEARAAIPQIEVAAGDDAVTLVLRHLAPLSEADRARLGAFARESGLGIALQAGGPETVAELWPAAQRLAYRLPEADVAIAFRATDFAQVNAAVNRRLVGLALALLAPGPGQRVLDLFCGLGNFSLPLARRAGQVVGVEGDAAMVARARENARANGLDNADFRAADLSADPAGAPWLAGGYDAVLLDPPRSGAREVVQRLGGTGARRLLYVSCHPATLARDAGILVSSQGYRLAAAGVVDMFPHTAHVESLALFERG